MLLLYLVRFLWPLKDKNFISLDILNGMVCIYIPQIKVVLIRRILSDEDEKYLKKKNNIHFATVLKNCPVGPNF